MFKFHIFQFTYTKVRVRKPNAFWRWQLWRRQRHTNIRPKIFQFLRSYKKVGKCMFHSILVTKLVSCDLENLKRFHEHLSAHSLQRTLKEQKGKPSFKFKRHHLWTYKDSEKIHLTVYVNCRPVCYHNYEAVNHHVLETF